MTYKRLPAKAYARQLDRMRVDLDAWHRSYRTHAAAQSNMWLAAKFEQRAAELHDVIGHLVTAESILFDLARTS